MVCASSITRRNEKESHTRATPQALLAVTPSSSCHPGGRPIRAFKISLTTPAGGAVLTRNINFVSQKEYASEVAGRLSSLGLYADVDNGENTLPKKIRNGEIAQYNFILGQFF